MYKNQYFKKKKEKDIEDPVENDNSQEVLSNNIPEDCAPVEIETVIKEFDDFANKVDDLEINEKILLNEDQSRIYDRWVNDLLKEKLIRSLISGFAGTGKSEILKRLVIFNKTVRNKRTITLGPTGLAALNVSGQTIHKFLLVPVEQNDEVPEYKAL